MQQKAVGASCLCGAVRFEISPPFSGFRYCHCSRCRKATGSAHAANIFFEIAPIILGLVLAPMLELNFRQSLAMSAGSYAIFFTRPIATGMLLVALVLLLLGMRAVFTRAAGPDLVTRG